MKGRLTIYTNFDIYSWLSLKYCRGQVQIRLNFNVFLQKHNGRFDDGNELKARVIPKRF